MNAGVARLANPAAVRQRLLSEARTLQRHCQRRRPTKDTIHEIRLGCKRLRAWLQLLRTATMKGKWRKHAKKLQCLARSLGAQRDSEVMALTLLELAEGCSTKALRNACQALADSLQQSRQVPPTRAMLRTTEPVMKALRTASIPDAIMLSAAVVESYRKGRKLTHDALLAGADDAVLHTLRKRTKALLYQLEMLSAEPHPQHDAWKRLGSRLGQLHDWQLLTEWLNDTGRKALPATTSAALIAAARLRQARCLRECRPLIRRLYSRSPTRWSAFRND